MAWTVSRVWARQSRAEALELAMLLLLMMMMMDRGLRGHFRALEGFAATSGPSRWVSGVWGALGLGVPCPLVSPLVGSAPNL